MEATSMSHHAHTLQGIISFDTLLWGVEPVVTHQTSGLESTGTSDSMIWLHSGLVAE